MGTGELKLPRHQRLSLYWAGVFCLLEATSDQKLFGLIQQVESTTLRVVARRDPNLKQPFAASRSPHDGASQSVDEEGDQGRSLLVSHPRPPNSPPRRPPRSCSSSAAGACSHRRAGVERAVGGTWATGRLTECLLTDWGPQAYNFERYRDDTGFVPGDPQEQAAQYPTLCVRMLVSVDH